MFVFWFHYEIDNIELFIREDIYSNVSIFESNPFTLLLIYPDIVIKVSTVSFFLQERKISASCARLDYLFTMLEAHY